MIELSNLLEGLKQLYEKFEEESERESYNIFKSLLKINDEVRLHSRFIKSLLSSDQNNTFSKTFLELFLDMLNLENLKEEKFKVYNEHKRIDIYLESEKSAIIIENKIWAGDQPEQLIRYYNQALCKGFKTDDIHVYYLTPYGQAPTELSYKAQEGSILEELPLNKINCISYQSEIKDWIEESLKKIELSLSIEEPIKQYLKIINEITGNTMNDNQLKETFEFLSQGENIIAASVIGNNWNEIKIKTEVNFWYELEKALIAKGKLLKDHDEQWSETRIRQVLKINNPHRKYLGLTYSIAPVMQKEIDGANISILIQRGPGNLIFGITSLNEMLDRQSSLINDKLLKSIIQEFNEDFTEYNNVWIGYNEFEPAINFESFSSPETLNLIKSEVRNKTIAKIIDECQGWEQRVINILKNFSTNENAI